MLSQPEPPANKPESSEQDSLSHSRSVAELEKLKLEIRDLKRKPRWLSPVLELLPMFTVLIAVVGSFLSIYQYLDGQRKARANQRVEQRLRIQTQARADLEQIFQFPVDPKQTLSRVGSLLVDLDNQERLIEFQQAATAEGIDTSAQDKRTTSILLLHLILQDATFNEPRNIDFADMVLTNRDDYAAFLKQEPAQVGNILIKHEDALHELHRKAPDYFEQITFNESQSQTIEPKGASVERPLYRHFEKLMNSFSAHLKLFADEKLKTEWIKKFQATICNPKLTEQKFGKSFDPKNDAELFDECIKKK